MNQDGSVNVTDVVQIVNTILPVGVTTIEENNLLKNILTILKRKDLDDDIKMKSINKITIRAGYHKSKLGTERKNKLHKKYKHIHHGINRNFNNHILIGRKK